MESVLKSIKKRFSKRKVCTLEPVKSVKIAIIGSRNVRGALILLNFFKRLPEGQTILDSLHSAQRAKLIVHLIDRDGCHPFYEQAISDCEVFLVLQENKDDKEKLTEFIDEIQQKKEGYPFQVFTVSNPEYNHSLTEVYPVLDGVQYSLCQYSQNIKVNAVSPNYSISQQFLDDFCNYL